MRRWCVGLIAVAFAGGPSGARLGAQADSADVDRAAYRLLDAGNVEAAERAFTARVSSAPDDAAAEFGVLYAEHARLDVDDSIEPTFARQLDAFVDRMDKRHGDHPEDADALRYLAQAYMLRAAYRYEGNQGMWGAAHDAAHARDRIDQYFKIRPDDGDAYLVRGMYDYFIDLAPTFAHVLRFLLFLPGGNRAEGLKEIERAAATGTLVRTQARLELVQIYALLEGRPADAIREGTALAREFPRNDDAAFALASVYASPAVEQRNKAAALYEQVMARRAHDDSEDGLAARAHAALSLAAVRFDEWQCQDAIALLTQTIDAHPDRPAWVMPQFLIRRANYRVLMNEPGGKQDAQRVLNDPKMAKWHKDASDMLHAIDQHRASGDAPMYAALVPANRLVAERRWDDARRAYAEIAQRAPADAQVRYRLAYLDFVQGQTGRAQPTFAALAESKAAPPWVRAWSWLYLGRIQDLTGARQQAEKAYQKVVDDYQNERPATAARVGLVTPYRRPTDTGQDR